MQYTKYLAGFAMAAGLFGACAPTAFAQNWRSYQEPNQYQYQGQYYEKQYDRGNRYDRIEELQEHIARDRARLDEAIRCGNDAEASRQAADLARDQRLLLNLIREVRGYESYPDNRRYRRAWSFGWGWR